MIDIRTDIPAELGPLSWLIGVWEGSGVIDYVIDGEHVTQEFGQRISFSHDGLPYLNYSAYAWTTDPLTVGGSAAPEKPLISETGYWRLSRPQTENDPGPGMLPGAEPAAFSTVESVESLRGGDGFPVEVSIVHPTGVSEVYLGAIQGPRITLATDYVMRTAGAKEYTAATRLYGLVEQHLLWAWDIAALGQPLATHASARLARRE
ncbi:hypothetical protein GCM10022198_22390 [Klugiella xanthotipulae]|uniref:Peroxynitrite isomerase n=1 Tax=Klugiella xanthotipulae TaxID=244735 RepID=A0A543HYF7_9MICO|nr:FABP family protein [Klugiella xanthotipulae]TQM63363.1 uncharacterized protein DUF1794 [Klugiella xanthotipulae]